MARALIRLSTAAPSSRRWLFGPFSDLTFGCGLAYAAVFVAMSAAGDSFRTLLPFAAAILPINLISSAHYGATALRAYEKSGFRRHRLVDVLEQNF